MESQHENCTDNERRITRLATRFETILPCAGPGENGTKLGVALAALVVDAIAGAERRIGQRLSAEAAARRRLIDRLQRR